MKYILLTFAILSVTILTAQVKKDSVDITFDKEKLLKELAETSCKCIDSIETYNIIKDTVASKISKCIDKVVVVYQVGLKLSNIRESNSKTENQDVSIEITIDKNSKDYKQFYFDFERNLMESCPSIKNKIAVNDIVIDNSLSKNRDAMRYYELGENQYSNKNYEKAIEFYQKAVAVDKKFAFAFDNMGLCFRKLKKYEDALNAFEKSLKINSEGQTPLQSIALTYSDLKEYRKSVNAYEKLAKVDKNNPEVFYGIGLVYTLYLFEYEKALENMCQAYIIYTNQKSPYRTDAENVIGTIYAEMKKQGKEEKFNEILKKYNINQN